jgi:hypothetical protein
LTRLFLIGLQDLGVGADLGRHRHALAEQQPLVAAEIADDFHLGSKLGVTLDQPTNG